MALDLGPQFARTSGCKVLLGHLHRLIVGTIGWYRCERCASFKFPTTQSNGMASLVQPEIVHIGTEIDNYVQTAADRYPLWYSYSPTTSIQCLPFFNAPDVPLHSLLLVRISWLTTL